MGTICSHAYLPRIGTPILRLGVTKRPGSYRHPTGCAPDFGARRPNTEGGAPPSSLCTKRTVQKSMLISPPNTAASSMSLSPFGRNTY
jgi:hypothetical protein